MSEEDHTSWLNDGRGGKGQPLRERERERWGFSFVMTR